MARREPDDDVRAGVGVAMRVTWGLLFAMLGCGDGFVTYEAEGLIVREGTARGGKRGIKLRVDTEGLEAVQVVVEPVDPSLRVHLRRLRDPSGPLLDATEQVATSRNVTNAIYLRDSLSLNWPILDQHDPMSDRRLDALIGLVGNDRRYTSGEVDVSIIGRPVGGVVDDMLRVNVVYIDGLSSVDGVIQAVDQATAAWRQVLGSVGLNLEVRYFNYDNDTALSAPGLGTPDSFRNIAQITPLRGVNLVIARRIADLDDVLGISGDIPGPMSPTGRAAVMVSTELAAGPDGVFSQEEVRLLGETMAHEVGHYLGLYHPVELEYDRWDSLEDTPECSDQADCIDAAGTNFMFPFPVCTTVRCLSQNQVTPQQAAVMFRWAGIK